MGYPSYSWADPAAYELVKSEFVNLPGVRLHYVDSGGDGEPAVFLHASTGSSQVWEHQIQKFISSGYRFIAYDRRSYGQSVPNDTGPQPGTGVDDLEGLIIHLGIDRFHLISTAAGGSVALDYTLSFPQRVRSLIMANTLGGLEDKVLTDMGKRIRPPASQFYALAPKHRELSPTYLAINPEGTQRWSEIARGNRVKGFETMRQNSKGVLTLASMKSLKTPTLFISGEADLYMPPPFMAIMADAVEGSESIIMPGIAHAAFWEQPQLFNKTALHFIGKY